SRRVLAREYKEEPDWSSLATLETPQDVLAAAEALLEAESFAKIFAYDALNRVTSTTFPDASIIVPGYNQAGLLKTVEVRVRGAGTSTPFVRNIDYNAKGQRELIEYGNGTATEYAYDPLTFRLTRLKTTRASDKAVLQNLFYTSDCVGNVMAIE